MEDELDLFERYEELPENIQAIVQRYSEQLEVGESDSYEVCKEFLDTLESHGYTFEYGLEGVPHSLKKCLD